MRQEHSAINSQIASSRPVRIDSVIWFYLAFVHDRKEIDSCCCTTSCKDSACGAQVTVTEFAASPPPPPFFFFSPAQLAFSITSQGTRAHTHTVSNTHTPLVTHTHTHTHRHTHTLFPCNQIQTGIHSAHPLCLSPLHPWRPHHSYFTQADIPNLFQTEIAP